MKKIILFVVIVAAFISLKPVPASAHVFIKDTTGQTGLVVHLTPDDDPIAGEPASFYFDIEDDLVNTKNFSFRLGVTSERGQTSFIAVTPTGEDSFKASYIFPTQGRYTLKLEGLSHQDEQKVLFEYAQRVSRGQNLSPLDQPRYQGAEILLIAVSCSFFILGIIAYSRRKQIAAYTKWK